MSLGCEFYDWMIVTVGKDQAWRVIDRKKLSDHGRRLSPGGSVVLGSVEACFRLSTGGFIYHVYHRYASIVALDVESETFYEFPSPTVPHSCDGADLAHFRPKAWVNNGKVVVFCVLRNPGPFIAHNVETGVTFLIGNCLRDLRYSEVHSYAWSLVSLSPS
ncbi:hypothetical protein Vadar_023246 [Vaccinium darrowii]|uniref:Uncharacterized protein n=1 Tax=Vaccinium darrowii TaxID=229202 RepID=A0ACB7ZDR6_9ERIC|nr:hypothetical protein Vadar_023246 [Vaccinium darrowii]